MEYKQFIFCLETNKKANTDWLYLHKIINHMNKGKQIYDRYKPLYMEGKGNYNNKSFIKKIKQEINMFDGDSIIIYCIDLDDYHTNYETQKFIENIEYFCKSNNYKFVFFSRDIEEVFWGKRLEQEDKKKYAAKFSKDIDITCEMLNRLRKETRSIKTSNLLLNSFLSESR